MTTDTTFSLVVGSLPTAGLEAPQQVALHFSPGASIMVVITNARQQMNFNIYDCMIGNKSLEQKKKELQQYLKNASGTDPISSTTSELIQGIVTNIVHTHTHKTMQQ